MSESKPEETGEPLVTNRTMEIAVALMLLMLSALVIYDSNRTGFGWIPGEGPAPGYFPFYIAVIMGTSALVIMIRAIAGYGAGITFVTKTEFGRVLAVLIPLAGFILLIELVGIYVASAVFISLFMLIIGRDSIVRSLLVGVGVPLALFFMFEKWFLVPLPKGPLEAMLGM